MLFHFLSVVKNVRNHIKRPLLPILTNFKFHYAVPSLFREKRLLWTQIFQSLILAQQNLIMKFSITGINQAISK